MQDIPAALVKELRDKTGAGMMDCKNALKETGGDIEAAVDWLRTKGLAAAAKKAGRAASEGLVGVCVRDNAGALVEVNAETDFLARNETFQEFVKAAAEIALASDGGLETLKGANYPGTDRTVAEQLTHLVATVGENMMLRRVQVVKVGQGILASYTHNALAPGLGKIGVIVALESEAEPEKLEEIGKQLAMHVAASKPQSVSRDDLDPAIAERERKFLAKQARASGKPEEIIEKMVEGRMRKFYEENCLLDQTFVIDAETKVGSVLDAAAADAGKPVSVRAFGLFVLGEGIEKKKQDFAAEVAAAIAD